MAVLSVLARCYSRTFDSKTRFLCARIARAAVADNIRSIQKIPQCSGVISRSMGGGSHGPKQVMRVLPSRYEYNVFKDQLHFYFMLGIIPLGALILYCNIFIGPATLTDTPEDYEPERWEYYRHPIQRWFARYVYNPPEKTYEITCHHMDREQQKLNYRRLEKKVKALMQDRGDYKAWYYAEIDDRKVMRGRVFHDDVAENRSMPEKFSAGAEK